MQKRGGLQLKPSVVPTFASHHVLSGNPDTASSAFLIDIPPAPTAPGSSSRLRWSRQRDEKGRLDEQQSLRERLGKSICGTGTVSAQLSLLHWPYPSQSVAYVFTYSARTAARRHVRIPLLTSRRPFVARFPPQSTTPKINAC